jgi:GAF domain-containing protein
MVIERISPLLDADAFVFHCLKSNHLGYQVCASKEIVADSISRVPREVQDNLRRYYEHHNVGVYSDSGNRCYGLPFYYNGLVVAVLQIVNLTSSHDLEGCTVLTSNLTVCSYLNQILTHSSGEKVPRTLLSIMEHYSAQDMEGVMNDTHTLFNSPRVNCFLSYNTERDLVCIHSRDSKGVHVRYDQGIVGWVAVNMKPVRITNVSEDPRFDPAIDEYTSTKTHEVLVAPILSRAGTLIGVLEVINPNSGCSIDMDSSIMGRLCSILSTMLAPTTFTLEKASAIYNKGTIAANEKVTAAESTQIALAESLHLKDTKTSLGKQVNIIKVLPSLMYEGSKLLGSTICNLYLLDSPASTTYWAISGSMSGSVNICNHSIEEGIAGQVMRTKQTFMENDVASNSVVRQDIDGLHLHYSNASIFQAESVIKNLLVTPLTDHNNILIGAVSVANKTTGDYTAKDQVLIENFRHVCAAAVSQADCHLALFCQPDDIDNESSAFAFTLSSRGMLRSSIRPLQYITGVDALTMSSSHFNEWLSIDLNKHLCLNIQSVFDTRKPIFVNDYILKKRNSEETMRISYLAAVLGGTSSSDNQSEPEVVILFESFGKVVVDISKVDTYRSQLSFLQSELRLLTTRSGATYELPVKRAMNILEQLLRTYKKENETAELLCECMSVLRSPDIFVNKLRVPRTTSGDTNTWLLQEFTTLSKKKSFKKGSKSLDRCDESSTGGGSEGSTAMHGNSFDASREGGDVVSSSPVAVAPTIEEAPALDVEDSRVRGPAKPLTVAKKPAARGADSKREVITNLSVSTVKSTMRRWDMDLFTMNEEELCRVVFDLFSELEILSYFHIDLTIFSNWVKKVAGNYRPNPFHNFLHGVNVAHKSFVIVTTTNAMRSLDRLDLLIVMVAALSHDLDHPGLNNAYCIKSKDPLALLYNDVSVLENHHASTCFRILASADANILQGMASTSFNEIRR